MISIRSYQAMMSRFVIHIVVGLYVSMVFVSCKASNQEKGSEPQKIYVFAAASVSPVLDELSKAYSGNHQVEIINNYASSGSLARQIAYGAPADIYVSADTKWTRYLESSDLVVGESRHLVENTLVIVSAVDNQLDAIDDIPELISSVDRIAIGDSSHVPAGRYAIDALRGLGINHIAQGKCLIAHDVASVLRLVELKEASIGIVYKNVALQSEKVKILYAFSRSEINPIEYNACLLSRENLASEFFEYLTSEDVLPTWEKNGFLPPKND